jgi:hypothetical protein
MFEMFKRLPDAYQGVIYILLGITAILYALGIIEKGIDTVIILFAICMVVLGCIKIGLYHKTINALSRITKKSKE